jgi:hypothetical protein
MTALQITQYENTARVLRSMVAALLLPMAVGCSETVGFVTIQLQAPTLSPQVSCELDPRRTHQLELAVRCGESLIEQTYAMPSSGWSMPELPLGECEVAVQTKNKHGRLLLAGKQNVTIAEGENGNVTIDLVEQTCTRPDCDSDADNVPDIDEQGLGLNPNKYDTDNDGINDGVEVYECCSDPTKPDGADCKLTIQQIFPLLAEANDSVLIRATKPFTDPVVTGAGQKFIDPPNLPFENTTIYIGQLNPKATIGPISLKDGKSSAEDTFDIPGFGTMLFGALMRAPQPSIELTTGNAVMTRIVDIAALGQDLFVLGEGASGTFGNTVPILLRYRHGFQSEKVAGSDPTLRSRALAIAAGFGRVAVLLTRGVKGADLLHYTPKNGSVTSMQRIELPSVVNARHLAVESGGQSVLVLGSDALWRVSLNNKSAAQIPLSIVTNGATGGAGSQAQARPSNCTGLAYQPLNSIAGVSDGAVYIACTGPCDTTQTKALPNNANGQNASGDPNDGSYTECKAPLMLVYLPSVAGCLGSSAGANSTCRFQVATSPGPDQAVGAPVYDERRNRIYLAGRRSGIYTSPIKGVSSLRPMQPTFQIPALTTSPNVLRLEPERNWLFVANSKVIRRFALEPNAPHPLAILFSGPNGIETADALTLTDSGCLLSYVSRLGYSQLTNICLKRGPACPCK